MDDTPVDITKEANFIWSIANKLRATYMPDKYGEVIIPMTIIRRFACVLAPTKAQVLVTYKKDKNYPARAGCDEKVLATVADWQPSRIVYVSCNPTTLARDVAYLATRGYAVTYVQPVDMFPHTTHVETIALIQKI